MWRTPSRPQTTSGRLSLSIQSQWVKGVLKVGVRAGWRGGADESAASRWGTETAPASASTDRVRNLRRVRGQGLSIRMGWLMRKGNAMKPRESTGDLARGPDDRPRCLCLQAGTAQLVLIVGHCRACVHGFRRACSASASRAFKMLSFSSLGSCGFTPQRLERGTFLLSRGSTGTKLIRYRRFISSGAVGPQIRSNVCKSRSGPDPGLGGRERFGIGRSRSPGL